MAPPSSAMPDSESPGKRKISGLFDSQATIYGGSFRTNYHRAMFAIESKWILEHLSGFHGTVLDIGTGRGRYAQFLSSGNGMVTKVLGVDISRAMLGDAAKAVITGKFRAILADGARLPIRSASVDGAMALRSMKYNVDWKAMVSEISRVVRPGGSLLLYDMGRPGSIQAALDRIQPHHRPRPELLPLEDLVSCLRASGFQIGEVRSFMVLPHIFYRTLESLPRIQRSIMDVEFQWGRKRQHRWGANNFLVAARRR